MDQAIQAMAKIGVVLGTSFPLIPAGPSLEEALIVVAEDPYFGAVELGGLPDSIDPKRVSDLCEQSRLTVAYAAGPTIFGQALSLNARDARDRHHAIEILEGCKENQLLPIATDSGGNKFVIVVADEDYGHIYFFDRWETPPRPYFLANTFDEFLSKIREPTPQELGEGEPAENAARVGREPLGHVGRVDAPGRLGGCGLPIARCVRHARHASSTL